MSTKKSIWRLVVKATGAEAKLGKLTGLADKVSNRFTKSQDKITKFTNSIRESASEIPYLGSAVRLVTNPIVALGAALVFTVGAMGTAINKAADYNHQFLELQNLNLGKPVNEIDRLNNSVLKTAFAAGTNATKTSEAYYNLQSSTGKYGEEIDKTVLKLANFSTATKANFDALVNGAGKAIKIFKLSSDDMDGFLESAAKTVQLGVTTFDQLANVQVDYFGNAAAAGQGFDEANKLFAAFTISSKSTQEAATLTKTAFQGLIDPSVQKGLKQYGINVFDTSGKMKSLDTITTDLVVRLKKMSDQDFSNFMGKVGGPEGLRTLLNTAKSNGDDLLATFQKFDNTKFDIEAALKNAKGDFVTLKQLVGNRLNVIMVKLGQQILPTVIRALQWFNDKLVAISNWFITNKSIIMDTLAGVKNGLMAAAAIWTILNAEMIITSGIIGIVTAAQWLLNIAMTANPIGLIVIAIVALITVFTILWRRSEKFRGFITGLGRAFMAFGKAIKEHVVMRFKQLLSGITGIGKALLHFFKGDWKKAWETGAEAVGNLTGVNPEALSHAKKSGEKIRNSFETGYNSGALKVRNHLAENSVNQTSKKKSTLNKLFGGGGSKPNSDSNSKLRSGINSISGGGKNVRNVSVVIQKLVETIVLKSQNVKEGAEEIKQIIQEEMIKAVNGYEIAADNG